MLTGLPRVFASVWRRRRVPRAPHPVHGYVGLPRTQAPSTRQRSVDFRNWGTFARVPLVLPPVEHQKSFVAEYHEQTTRIDALIAKAKEHIALAKERRAALIAAAVTGQFDVRTARKAG